MEKRSTWYSYIVTVSGLIFSLFPPPKTWQPAAIGWPTLFIPLYTILSGSPFPSGDSFDLCFTIFLEETCASCFCFFPSFFTAFPARSSHRARCLTAFSSNLFRFSTSLTALAFSFFCNSEMSSAEVWELAVVIIVGCFCGMFTGYERDIRGLFGNKDWFAINIDCNRLIWSLNFWFSLCSWWFSCCNRLKGSDIETSGRQKRSTGVSAALIVILVKKNMDGANAAGKMILGLNEHILVWWKDDRMPSKVNIWPHTCQTKVVEW